MLFFLRLVYSERIGATSCDNINITTKLNKSTNFNTTSYVYRLKQLLHDKCKDIGMISEMGHSLKDQSLKILFKFTPSGSITTDNIDQAITMCRNNIVNELKQDLSVLLPKLKLSLEQSRIIGNVTWQFESCCDTKSKYCCPSGSLVRSTGGLLKNVVCCKFVIFIIF